MILLMLIHEYIKVASFTCVMVIGAIASAYYIAVGLALAFNLDIPGW